MGGTQGTINSTFTPTSLCACDLGASLPICPPSLDLEGQTSEAMQVPPRNLWLCARVLSHQ